MSLVGASKIGVGVVARKTGSIFRSVGVGPLAQRPTGPVIATSLHVHVDALDEHGIIARMVLVYVGAPIALLGLTMLIRGWVYTLRPNGKMAEKRKRRNLKVGFTTDMKLFGRKVRRLGLILVIVGAGMMGWHLSSTMEEAPQSVPATAP